MAITLSRIMQPVVQAVGTALPEFDRFRPEPITSPGWRGRDLRSVVFRVQLAHPGLQELAVGYGRTLPRRPSAELGSARPAAKVRLGFRTRGLYHCSGDAYLPVQIRPIE